MIVENPQSSSSLVNPPGRPALAKPMLLAGVGAACVLGLALGLLARPQLAPDSRAEGSMKPVDQVQIQIDRDEPLPAVTGGKLELLPAGTPRAQAPVRPAVQPINDIEPAAPSEPARPVSRGPSFDCARSESAAEAMVCNDEALAAQDRTLATAWRRALDSGVPTWRLRRQQQSWLDAREEAARNSPEDVSDLYDQRIRELQDVAAEDDR